jgi:hypothetical protein
MAQEAKRLHASQDTLEQNVARQFERAAQEDRLQTMLMRDMLANQMWQGCVMQERGASTCKAQQDSIRRQWFVQDSMAMAAVDRPLE